MKTKRRIIKDNYMDKYFVQYRCWFMWFDYKIPDAYYLSAGIVRMEPVQFDTVEDAREFISLVETDRAGIVSLPTERYTIIPLVADPNIHRM
jgi:hypothetical protein